MTAHGNNVDKNQTANLSPCIRNCCLNDDDICLGCFRHLNEIIGWREFGETEQQNILIKCKERKKSNNQ